MDTVFKEINYKEGFYEVVCKTARTESDIVNIALLRENVDGARPGEGRDPVGTLLNTWTLLRDRLPGEPAHLFMCACLNILESTGTQNSQRACPIK